jgi:hypothetical protein
LRWEARRINAKAGASANFEFYDLNVRYDFMDFLGLLDLGVYGVIEQLASCRKREASDLHGLYYYSCSRLSLLLVEHFGSVHIVDGIGCFQKKWIVLEKGIKAPKHSDGIERFGQDWIGKVDILAWQSAWHPGVRRGGSILKWKQRRLVNSLENDGYNIRDGTIIPVPIRKLVQTLEDCELGNSKPRFASILFPSPLGCGHI